MGKSEKKVKKSKKSSSKDAEPPAKKQKVSSPKDKKSKKDKKDKKDKKSSKEDKKAAKKAAKKKAEEEAAAAAKKKAEEEAAAKKKAEEEAAAKKKAEEEKNDSSSDDSSSDSGSGSDSDSGSGSDSDSDSDSDDDDKEEDAVQALKKTLTGKRKSPEKNDDKDGSSSDSSDGSDGSDSSDSDDDDDDDNKKDDKAMDADTSDVKKEDEDADDGMKIHEKSEPINSQVDAECAKRNEGNPKLFLSNLSWDLTDDSCREFFKDCGDIVDIYWFTDRETGQFKGMGKVTFDTPENAIKALKKQDMDLMGRPLNIKYSEEKKRDGAFGASPRKPFQNKPLSPKPDGCVTVFCGNLSYNIDDAGIKDFFKDCGEVANVRWLTDRETGDFKGCGFVEFYDGNGPDLAVKKSGVNLMGRDIRVDYASSRNK